MRLPRAPRLRHRRPHRPPRPLTRSAYRIRNPLRDGEDHLTDHQDARLSAAFTADERHVQSESPTAAPSRSARTITRPTTPQEPDRDPDPRQLRLLPDPRSRPARPDPATVGTRVRRLPRHRRRQQRPHRSRQRTPRTPTRHSPRIPQPHQLHRQMPARNRRLQTPPTPWIVMSRISPRESASSWRLSTSASGWDSRQTEFGPTRIAITPSEPGTIV